MEGVAQCTCGRPAFYDGVRCWNCYEFATRGLERRYKYDGSKATYEDRDIDANGYYSNARNAMESANDSD